MDNKKLNWRKILIATILASSLVLSGCSSTQEDNSSTPNDDTSSVGAESSEGESSEDPQANPQAMAIDYSLISENFFGVWEDSAAPDAKIYLGLGSSSFDGTGMYVTTVNTAEDGKTIVMDVINGGEPYKYTINVDEPTKMTVTSVNDEVAKAEYTKTGDVESTDIFGYFNILDFAAKANIADEAQWRTAFYSTQVTLEDGSVWERIGNLEYALPELHIVEDAEGVLKLTSLFFPQGTELNENSLSVAQNITFTVAVEDGKMIVKDAVAA